MTKAAPDHSLQLPACINLHNDIDWHRLEAAPATHPDQTTPLLTPPPETTTTGYAGSTVEGLFADDRRS